MTADLGPAATPRPVESPEDRMRHATADTRDASPIIHTPAAPTPPAGRSFGTYLDRSERDQLDARAATAEQERDDALDDLQDVRAEIAALRQRVDVVTRQRDNHAAQADRMSAEVSRLQGVVEGNRRAAVEALDARDDLRHQLDAIKNRHPGDALVDALRNAYTPDDLKTLHERTLEELDDDAPREDPLGRLVDALFAARWHQRPMANGGIVHSLNVAAVLGEQGCQLASPPGLGSPADRAQEQPACTCYPSGFNPGTYEGPMRDCPVHGELSAEARP